jgi:hypothetical protein
MKVSQLAVCLLCDEAFDMEEHNVCPHCLNTSIWPLHRWIRSLYGSNAHIERINHEESPDSVQEALPLVVGEELYHCGTYLPLHLVQAVQSRCFNEERQERINAGKTVSVASTLRRTQATPDQSDNTCRILGSCNGYLVSGGNRENASHAVNGKMAWFTALKSRIKRSIDQRLRRVPDPIVLPRKGEWQSSESAD